MKNKVINFEETKVWQDAADLGVKVYEVTRDFPKEEMFGITSQLRRAALSVSANIAEGYGRYGKKEKHQFYSIAYGSLLETKSFLLIAVRLGYIDALGVLEETIISLKKQINAMRSSMR